MASEYTLQLKAMLDTSDVQQKLNQLKQQQGASGGNGGLGNGGIQQALQRLNTTLTNLQRSIDKLYVKQGKNNVISSGSVYALSGSGAFKASLYTPKEKMDFSSRAVKMFKEADKNSEEYKKFKNLRDERLAYNRIKRDLNPPSRRSLRTSSGNVVTAQASTIQGRYRLQNIETWKGNTLSQSTISNRQNLMTNSPSVKQELEGRHRLQNIETWKGGGQKLTPEAKENLRMGAGLVFGTVAGGIENYAQATGNQGLATGAGFVKNIGYGAAAGALVGGPIGAVIGGSVGALNSAFEELARRAREAASALDEQHKRIFSGQKVDNALADMFRSQKDRKALEKNDRSYFEAELKKEQALYNKTTESLGKEVGVGGEGRERFNLREYEKETERLMKLRGQDDAEVKRRQNVATLYTANAEVLQKSDARITELQSILKSLGPAPRTPLNKRRADVAAEQAESLREALKNLKAPDLANVNSLASQGFMISAAHDEERLDEANNHLADLVNLTRQIKDKDNEAAVYS